MTKSQLLKALAQFPDDTPIVLESPFIHGALIDIVDPLAVTMGLNHYGSADSPPHWYRQDKYPHIKNPRGAALLTFQPPIPDRLAVCPSCRPRP